MINFLLAAGEHGTIPFTHFSEWLPEYFQLVRDPAHIALELTLMAVFDGIIFGLIWRALRSYVRSHHTKDVTQLIEAEHDYHEFNEDNFKDIEQRIRHLEVSMNTWQNQQDKV